MAERYGGKYSPDPAENGMADTRATPRGPFDGKRRSKVGSRANFLFFVPIPFVLFAFQREPAAMALDLVAFGLLVLAAWLTREGLLAQEAYEARRVARRPAIPRKFLAAVLIGAGLFVGGYVPGESLLNPIIFAILGPVLHMFAFGFDPRKDKGMEGIDPFQTDRVARAVTVAESHLKAMKDAILRANDRVLEARVDKFQATARDMFRTIEADPRDLTGAREYLGVFLMGAKDATVKFADIWASTRDPQARRDYESLLDDLESNFTARTRQMLLDDRSDLTVEIEVLRARLQRGVRSTE